MHPSKLLLAAFIGGVCSLAVGELTAQQPVPAAPTRVGLRENNISVRNAGQLPAQPTSRGGTRPNQPASELSYIAVIGAVKTPTVFETTERAIPLKALLERAGGVTADSIGTVRVLQHAQTRYITDLQNHLDVALTDGQVVLVLPRGGRPAQVADPRQAPPDRFILISGLARGPLLFNIGNQSRTFADLLKLLGQAPDMIDRQQVSATLPHGQKLQFDSLLVHNTVIDFDPQAVTIEGVREAVDRGFRYELPVKYESRPVAPTKEAVPANATTTQPAETAPVPAKTVPTLATPTTPLPVIRPHTAPVRTPTPAPTSATSDANTVRQKSGIERAGSSIQFEEPMPFPSSTPIESGAVEQAPNIKSDGRPPLMLPRSWQNPDAAGNEPNAEDPVRTIERSSADRSTPSRHIVTVSAEVEDRESSPPLSKPTAGAATTDSAGSPESPATQTSLFRGPLSWPILLATIGVAIASVVVSRLLSRKVPQTEGQGTDAVRSAATTAEAAATREPAHADEQRDLQRLILNKIPLIEEEASLPPVDRLHGIVIGSRRLVIHDAHEAVAGPHFKVKAPGETLAVELQLRRVMRGDRSATRQTAAVVHTAEVVGTRSSRVSPLEKALRTMAPRTLDRGDPQ